MFKLTPLPDGAADCRRVEFTCCWKAGSTVAVAGSFNDWDPELFPLEYVSAEKLYRGTAVLKCGDYEYKFVIDGNWVADEENPGFIANDFGTLNSVVTVK